MDICCSTISYHKREKESHKADLDRAERLSVCSWDHALTDVCRGLCHSLISSGLMWLFFYLNGKSVKYSAYMMNSSFKQNRIHDFFNSVLHWGGCGFLNGAQRWHRIRALLKGTRAVRHMPVPHLGNGEKKWMREIKSAKWTLGGTVSSSS